MIFCISWPPPVRLNLHRLPARGLSFIYGDNTRWRGNENVLERNNAVHNGISHLTMGYRTNFHLPAIFWTLRRWETWSYRRWSGWEPLQVPGPTSGMRSGRNGSDIAIRCQHRPEVRIEAEGLNSRTVRCLALARSAVRTLSGHSGTSRIQ